MTRRFPKPAERAEKLDELATLLDAGLDWQQVQSSAGLAVSDQAPAERLQQAGLVQTGEMDLLKAMDEIGRLDRGLSLLAAKLRARALLEGRMKARLTLPIAIWFLALLTAPVPALFRGDLSFLGYCWAVMGPMLLTLVVFMLAFRYGHDLIRQWRDFHLAAGNGPGRVQRAELHRDLGHCLDAGLPADQALLCLARPDTGEWRRRLCQAAEFCRSGLALVPALVKAQLINEQDRGMLETAESAGRLPESLLHQSRLMAHELALRGDMLAEWLPRIIYFLILLYMARHILSSGGVFTA